MSFHESSAYEKATCVSTLRVKESSGFRDSCSDCSGTLQVKEHQVAPNAGTKDPGSWESGFHAVRVLPFSYILSGVVLDLTANVGIQMNTLLPLEAQDKYGITCSG